MVGGKGTLTSTGVGENDCNVAFVRRWMHNTNMLSCALS